MLKSLTTNLGERIAHYNRKRACNNNPLPKWARQCKENKFEVFFKLLLCPALIVTSMGNSDKYIRPGNDGFE